MARLSSISSLLVFLGVVGQLHGDAQNVDLGRSQFQVNPSDYAGTPALPVAAPPFKKTVAPAGAGLKLEGHATTFGANGQALSGQQDPRRIEALGADAERFVLNAQTEVKVPPVELRAWLERTHPQFKLNAQMNPDAVIEVKGQWDDSAKILEAMGIRFRHIKGGELKDISLDNTRVLVINCGGRVPKQAYQKINDWVARGGYLISTDYALKECIEKVFPGTVAWNGEHADGVVDAVVSSTDPSRFAGTPVSRTTWKLDLESQLVRVIDPRKVKVLARSYMLAARDKNRRSDPDPGHWGILALEFRHGRGKVLHMVGHYDYNAPALRRHTLLDSMPGAGVSLRQALATNFLLEGLAAKERKPGSVSYGGTP